MPGVGGDVLDALVAVVEGVLEEADAPAGDPVHGGETDQLPALVGEHRSRDDGQRPLRHARTEV